MMSYDDVYKIVMAGFMISMATAAVVGGAVTAVVMYYYYI